jgi:hypothetical protein
MASSGRSSPRRSNRALAFVGSRSPPRIRTFNAYALIVSRVSGPYSDGMCDSMSARNGPARSIAVAGTE